MTTASIDSMIASSKKSLKKAKNKPRKPDDLDSDLDMDLDDNADDSSEGKKARRSKRRAVKASEEKAAKSDKKGKAAKKEKSAGKSERKSKRKGKEAAESKKEKPAKVKAGRKGARKAKAEEAKPSKRAAKAARGSASTDISKGDFAKFFAQESVERPGKFDASDPVSVSNHFLYGAYREVSRQTSIKSITSAISSAIRDTFGAKVDSKHLEAAAKSIRVKALESTARRVKARLTELRRSAKEDNGFSREDVNRALDDLFNE